MTNAVITKRVLRSKWLWLVLILVVTVVILATLLAKPSTDTLVLDERAENWRLANFNYKASAQDGTNYALLWGIDDTQAQNDKDSIPWSLKGVIIEGGAYIALIELDLDAQKNMRDRFVRFSVGQALPDGATIVSINKDSVDYEMDGVKETKRLYQ
ncbi:hypothetical protein PN836_012705 [Ningiella sp. W23]|uniref:hypothetical protein n=1 Tax=Ningiella sp. W23 TaxID=3023715 RepID=UPI0037568633